MPALLAEVDASPTENGGGDTAHFLFRERGKKSPTSPAGAYNSFCAQASFVILDTNNGWGGQAHPQGSVARGLPAGSSVGGSSRRDLTLLNESFCKGHILIHNLQRQVPVRAAYDLQ